MAICNSSQCKGTHHLFFSLHKVEKILAARLILACMTMAVGLITDLVPSFRGEQPNRDALKVTCGPELELSSFWPAKTSIAYRRLAGERLYF